MRAPPWIAVCPNQRLTEKPSCEAEHAVRRDQVARATELLDAASDPSLVHPPADFGDQCHPRSSCGVRHRRTDRAPWREQLLGVVSDAGDTRLPEVARACLAALGAQLRTLKAQILQFDRMITARHRSSEASRRLDDIP